MSIDFADPNNHSSVLQFTCTISGRGRDFLELLARRFHEQDGYPWDWHTVARRVIEEFAMNHPDYHRLYEEPGRLPARGPERELINELSRRYGFTR